MPRPHLNPRAAARAAAALVAGWVAVAGLAVAAPAGAAGSVGVDNGGRGAVIDGSYSSTLSVSGRGFQSVKGGHGGVYVWFGTVNGTWQPSRGGTSGVNYVYVPDSETKGNKGFQRYVAFPGSDTAGSANGGTMGADGSWRVQLVVPGPTFQGVGRNGRVQTVDCRKVTCGVITVGAHGVHNANNETFTPVRIADLAGGQPSATQPSTPVAPLEQGGQVTPPQAAPGVPATTPVKLGKPKLEVDRASALAGRGLSFLARNLAPASQVTLVLDDGLVASGPHQVGADGTVAGVLQLPDDLRPGTHELRTFGSGRTASVKFGVPDSTAPTAAEPEAEAAAAWEGLSPASLVFLGVAGLAFVAALVFSVTRGRRDRRASA